jgi:hypothetical protein
MSAAPYHWEALDAAVFDVDLADTEATVGIITGHDELRGLDILVSNRAS